MITRIVDALDRLRLGKARDRNMALAAAWGVRMSPDVFELPKGLVNPYRLVHLVEEVESVWPQGYIPEQGPAQWQMRFDDLARVTGAHFPRSWTRSKRVGVALRVWAGCISAAKVIALETRSGPNSRATRRRGSEYIEAECIADPLYAAGVSVARLLKQQRQQPVSFEGVPYYSWLAQALADPEERRDPGVVKRQKPERKERMANAWAFLAVAGLAILYAALGALAGMIVFDAFTK